MTKIKNKVCSVSKQTQIDDDKKIKVKGDSKKDHHISVLHLAGITPADIAKKTGFTAITCRKVTKAIDKELSGMSTVILTSIIRKEFMRLLATHTHTSNDLLVQLVDNQMIRDAAKQYRDLDHGKVVKDSDIDKAINKAIKLVSSKDATIRTLISSIGTNNKAFVDTIERMGVPRSDKGKEKKDTIPSPTAIEYSDLSKNETKVALKQSLQRQLDHLKKEEKVVDKE